MKDIFYNVPSLMPIKKDMYYANKSILALKYTSRLGSLRVVSPIKNLRTKSEDFCEDDINVTSALGFKKTLCCGILGIRMASKKQS